MSVSARAALRARTPEIYLRGGFCGADGRIRPELLDSEAVAVTTQLAETQLSPQEMAFTWEALRALLPMQDGDAEARMRGGLAGREDIYRQFEQWWGQWTHGFKKEPIPRPDDWRSSVDSFQDRLRRFVGLPAS